MTGFPKFVLVGIAVLALVPSTMGDGGGDAARAVFGGRQTVASSAYNLGVSPTETLTIRFLERPLKVPIVGNWLQSNTGGTASHVQIAAYDSKGRIVDNFGLTSSESSMATRPAAIEVETARAIEGKYNQTPLGEIRMTAADYIRARDETKQQVQYYSPLNNVDLDGAVRTGSAIGAFVGEKVSSSLPVIAPEMVSKIAGSVVGGIAGGRMAVSAYQSTGGTEPGIVDDSSAKMCFTAENCHYLPIRFLLNGDGTYQVVKPYTIPGPSGTDEAPDGSQVTATEGEVVFPAETSVETQADVWNGVPDDGVSAVDTSEPDSPEDEPAPPLQTVPDAVGNTPEEVAVAWLKAYNARDLERMKELSMPEFVEMWETGRDDFPNPPGNWRDAVIEATQTSADEATSSNPDWESIEIGVEFVCTGADSTTYEGGIAIYRYKSSGLYKVGFALIALPE